MTTDQPQPSKNLPTLDEELRLWVHGLERVAGVDEAGLGALAGPVVAAACIVRPGCPMIPGVTDSKLLSPDHRLRLDRQIRSQALAVGVGFASVAEIERLNVRRASHLAMERALHRLGSYDFALIDGLPIRQCRFGPHNCLVGGDLACYSVACASIVAKVARDAHLRRLGLRHPGYGWEHNAGYGTPEHLMAMRRLGLTRHHRLSYEPVRALLAPDDEGAVSQPALGGTRDTQSA